MVLSQVDMVNPTKGNVNDFDHDTLSLLYNPAHTKASYAREDTSFCSFVKSVTLFEKAIRLSATRRACEFYHPDGFI
jgi:hypothetical protein